MKRTTVTKLTTAHTADPASQKRFVLEQVVPEALNEPAAHAEKNESERTLIVDDRVDDRLMTDVSAPRLLECETDGAFNHFNVPVQTREVPLPALEKPPVQVHAVAPAALVLPAGQAVQVAEPAFTLYVLALQTEIIEGVKERTRPTHVLVFLVSRLLNLGSFRSDRRTCAHERRAAAGLGVASGAGARRGVCSARAVARAGRAGAGLGRAVRSSNAG